jgi:hypothetical protein
MAYDHTKRDVNIGGGKVIDVNDIKFDAFSGSFRWGLYDVTDYLREDQKSLKVFKGVPTQYAHNQDGIATDAEVRKKSIGGQPTPEEVQQGQFGQIKLIAVVLVVIIGLYLIFK